jgi:hypothetical protein
LEIASWNTPTLTLKVLLREKTWTDRRNCEEIESKEKEHRVRREKMEKWCRDN